MAELGIAAGEPRQESAATHAGSTVRIDNPVSLPLPNASVDNVILANGLAWLPWMVRDDERAGDVQEHFLRECHRVLRPSGQLVLATPNRLGLATWSGRRDPFTGLRWVGLMPRPVASGMSWIVRGKPYREHVYTWRGYAERLRRAGFVRASYHVPWPRAGRWEYVILDAIGSTSSDFAVRSRTMRWRLTSVLFRSLRRLSLHSLVFPDLFIVCAKEEDASALTGRTQGLLARILGREGVPTLSNLELRHRGSTETLLVETPSVFLKIPLSTHGVERQEAEIRALRRLEGTELAKHTLQEARMGDVASVRYSVYPRVPSVSASNCADRRRLECALDLLFRESQLRRLRETATWSRILSEPSRKLFDGAGGAAIIDEMESRLAEKQVPAGIVHGDLKYGNLLERDGLLTIIDWDRFENPAPLLLDGMHALFHETLRQERGPVAPGQRYLAALARLLERPRGGLVGRVDRVIGELDWSEAVTLYVVSYQQHLLGVSAASGRARETQEAVRLRLGLCERAWR